MQNAIEICNVCHSFKETEVLKQINLSVKKGEIFGLLGPSGAGKTTLINIITGQLHPSEGKSIIQGVDSALLSGDEYKKIVLKLQLRLRHFRVKKYRKFPLPRYQTL